jgi:hypothetical protein
MCLQLISVAACSEDDKLSDFGREIFPAILFRILYLHLAFLKP